MATDDEETSGEPTLRGRITRIRANVRAHPWLWSSGSGIAIAAGVLVWFLFFVTVSIVERYRETSQAIQTAAPSVDSRTAPLQEFLVKNIKTGELAAESEIALTDEWRPVRRLNSYIVQLEPDSGSEQVASFLEKYGLRVNGGIKEVGLLFVERDDQGRDSTQIQDKEFGKTLLSQMHAEPIVKRIVRDFVVEGQDISSPVDTQVQDDTGKVHTWTWFEPESGETDGNWGLKAIRAPQAWAVLNRKHEAASAAMPHVDVAVLDTGFAAHEDISFRGSVATSVSNHGNHVAGIVGAVVNNGKGIDGVAPNTNILPVTPAYATLRTVRDEGIGSIELRAAMTDVLSALNRLIIDEREIRIVNFSIGFNSRSLIGFDQDADSDDAREFVLLGQMTQNALEFYEATRDLLIVSSAGNDSFPGDPYHAVYGNPINWAALNTLVGDDNRYLQNVIVVESIGRNGKTSSFSNVGGHVSAPGENVLSLTATSATSYGLKSGTSQAAPFVTGAAAILSKFQPNLEMAHIRQHLIESSTFSNGSGAPLLDVFTALIASNEDEAMRYLADIDGNGEVNGDDKELLQRILDEISARQVNEDLNNDGMIDNNEAYWARIDLNGSGVLSASQADRVFIFGAPRTDLEVMQYALENN